MLLKVMDISLKYIYFMFLGGVREITIKLMSFIIIQKANGP